MPTYLTETSGASGGSPASLDYVATTLATSVASYQPLASAYPATALTTHGTSVSNATTNTALVTVPAASVGNAVAGSVFYLRAAGILASPSTGMPTLAFHAYSGGSSGTVLDTFTGPTMTASLVATNSMFDVEAWVSFYSATTVQAVIKATISTSGTTSAAAVYLNGNASATPVTVTAATSLTLNAVMGSGVASSSYEATAGFWNQLV
jgi:hypothetical protein